MFLCFQGHFSKTASFVFNKSIVPLGILKNSRISTYLIPHSSFKNLIIFLKDGYQGVKYIDELFKVEREIENEKVAQRREKSVPIVKKFYEWVSLTSQKYITNKKLKEALRYAKNQEENLIKFLDDGRIPLTNSKAERAIRPFAVHRKNWLFADTIEGAKANSIYYSLIESAQANNLNIYKYIKYLLDELPLLEGEQTGETIEKYLPWSKELPVEILNYEGTYKEINLE